MYCNPTIKLVLTIQRYLICVKLFDTIKADFAVELEDMLFGGTEKEILERGTDWCFNLARLAAVILDSIGMPTRFVFAANPHKAYHGHVLLEAYYDDAWGVIDPLYGYVFFDGKPISAIDIASSARLNSLDTDYRGLFDQIAIAEYDPNDQDNQYLVSQCNEYTHRLNTLQQDGTWLLGEDEQATCMQERKIRQ